MEGEKKFGEICLTRRIGELLHVVHNGQVMTIEVASIKGKSQTRLRFGGSRDFIIIRGEVLDQMRDGKQVSSELQSIVNESGLLDYA